MEFSELALQKLIQLFPELSNNIVNFRDITDSSSVEENSDIKVGVFIVQFGNGYAYIPVISKGEVLQPIDSLFSVEDQSFSPLTASLVKNLINQTGVEFGKKTKIPSTITHNPSVYNMVVPPRTGKFVYASTSRLNGLLSVAPSFVKKAFLEKITSDKSIYSALHKLFGLENLLAGIAPSAAKVPTQVPVTSPTARVITTGENLSQGSIDSILSKGYAIEGDHPVNRFAISMLDYRDSSMFRNLSSNEAGMDYKIPLKTGSTRNGFLPKKSKLSYEPIALLSRGFHPTHHNSPVFIMYENGDYSFGSTISIGEGKEGHDVLQDLFSVSQPKTPKDIVNGEKFVLMSPDLEVLGVYQANSVSLDANGVSIAVLSLAPGASYHSQRISAYRNCTSITGSEGNTFIPYNTLVVSLGKDITNQLETNTNSAQIRAEAVSTDNMSPMNIGYDGVEFSCNGKPVGQEPGIIEILVIKEGIEPKRAEAFVKQAKENKRVTVYLSKKADFEPTNNIPEYGTAPLPQQDQSILSGFDGRVADAIRTEDPEAVESTIISELLQVSNMKEYAREYLPDIKNALDKLGRILLLARLNVEKLALTHSAEEINAFLSNLRNVYRSLGDNFNKLTKLVQDSEQQPTDKVK